MVEHQLRTRYYGEGGEGHSRFEREILALSCAIAYDSAAVHSLPAGAFRLLYLLDTGLVGCFKGTDIFCSFCDLR